MAQQFKILGHETWYEVTEVTAQQAHNAGCPTATHRIEGPRTHSLYWGRFEWNGKRVSKIPGTTNRHGIKAVFHTETPGTDDVRLPGHLTTD